MKKYERELTGKFYHKRSLFGMILMVQIKAGSWPFQSIYYSKAKEHEIKQLGL